MNYGKYIQLGDLSAGGPISIYYMQHHKG